MIEHRLRAVMNGYHGNIIYFNDGKSDDKIMTCKQGGNFVVKYIAEEFCFQKEVAMLRELNNCDMLRNVVKALCIDETSRYVMFDRYDSDLFDIYVDPVKVAAISRECRVTIISDLADAIIDLHAHGISHRDIKPDNILVNYTATGIKISLCDFGLSSYSTTVRTRDKCAGSPAWVAPEIIVRRDHDTEPTDWWSFGLVAFLVMSGYPFYADIGKPDTNRNRFVQSLSNGWESVWPIYSPRTQEEMEFIEAFVCLDPETRASASNVKSFAYLA
jgi:serine/threonine protein kinase